MSYHFSTIFNLFIRKYETFSQIMTPVQPQKGISCVKAQGTLFRRCCSRLTEIRLKRCQQPCRLPSAFHGLFPGQKTCHRHIFAPPLAGPPSSSPVSRTKKRETFRSPFSCERLPKRSRIGRKTTQKYTNRIILRLVVLHIQRIYQKNQVLKRNQVFS